MFNINPPPIFDHIVKRVQAFDKITLNGIEWIAKPDLSYYRWTNLSRFYHAWLVLTNKALAVQFAEDHPVDLLPTSPTGLDPLIASDKVVGWCNSHKDSILVKTIQREDGRWVFAGRRHYGWGYKTREEAYLTAHRKEAPECGAD